MARKGINNPDFAEDSLKRMSWTRVVVGDKVFPTGRRCVGPCGQYVKRDEIVITIPVRSGGELVTTIVVHKTCLVRFLQDVPDQLSVVKAKVEKIKEKFVMAE